MPDDLLNLPAAEKLRRFDDMVRATFSHVDGRDLLAEIHPRKTLDIKRRVDARETWFEGDWLTNVMWARDGHASLRGQSSSAGSASRGVNPDAR